MGYNENEMVDQKKKKNVFNIVRHHSSDPFTFKFVELRRGKENTNFNQSKNINVTSLRYLIFFGSHAK